MLSMLSFRTSNILLMFLMILFKAQFLVKKLTKKKKSLKESVESSKLARLLQLWVQVVQEKQHYWTFSLAASIQTKEGEDLQTIWSTVTKPLGTLPIMWCKPMFWCKPLLWDKHLSLLPNSNLICLWMKEKKEFEFYQRKWNFKSVWTLLLVESSWKVSQVVKKREFQLRLN